MKLQPISRANLDAALHLLAEGFPALPAHVWRDCLEKMLAYAESIGEDAIGRILQAGGEDAGICLTLPANRHIYAATPRRDMNFSAFYMRPGRQWMTTLFLRRLMADPAVDYLDLTPSHSMREINRRLGFADQSAGIMLVPVAIASLRPSRQVRLMALSQVQDDRLDAAHRRILEAHRMLGCHCLVIEEEGVLHPLILAPTRHKGIAGARVILARDRALVRRALGPISRYLLRRGFAYLEYDAMEKHGVPEAIFWRQAAPVQTTCALDSDAIDLTFCELAFIPSRRIQASVRTLPQRLKARLRVLCGTDRVTLMADPATGMALKLAEIGLV